MSLKGRGQQRLAITLAGLAALLLSTGSLRFWQAWLFLILMSGFWTFFFIDLLKHDPQLLQRRLERKETQPEQRLFQKLLSVISFSAFTLAGLDFRFGWSRAWLGPVPLWLIIVGQIIAAAGYWLVFWVMKTNSFASSTIRVETGQRVVRSGPYAAVRHPPIFRHGGDGLGHAAGAGIISHLARVRVVDPGSRLPVDSRGKISSSCFAGLRSVLRANSLPTGSIRLVGTGKMSCAAIAQGAHPKWALRGRRAIIQRILYRRASICSK